MPKVSKTKVIFDEGVFYIDVPPRKRPNVLALQKDGVIIRFDYKTSWVWLDRFCRVYGCSKWATPTKDNINGMLLQLDFDNELIIPVTRQPQWGQNMYILDVYTRKKGKCIFQVVCDNSVIDLYNVPRHKLVDCAGTGVDRDEVIKVLAGRIAQCFYAMVCYQNITKYELFDDATKTYGPRIVDLTPFKVFDKEVC